MNSPDEPTLKPFPDGVLHQIADQMLKDPNRRPKLISYAREYLERAISEFGHRRGERIDRTLRWIIDYLEITNDPAYERLAMLYKRAVAVAEMLKPVETCAHLRTPKGLCVSCGATT